MMTSNIGISAVPSLPVIADVLQIGVVEPLDYGQKLRSLVLRIDSRQFAVRENVRQRDGVDFHPDLTACIERQKRLPQKNAAGRYLRFPVESLDVRPACGYIFQKIATRPPFEIPEKRVGQFFTSSSRDSMRKLSMSATKPRMASKILGYFWNTDAMYSGVYGISLPLASVNPRQSSTTVSA